MRLSWKETREFLAMIQALLEVQAITVEHHAVGLGLAERYGLSIFDAMIAAVALDAGCDRLWSEDMQDGILLAYRVRVVNPFNR